MLARANRLVRADEYRQTVRRGRRLAGRNMVVYVLERAGENVPRFGFIVSKATGNAVTRNLIRRRLKSVCRSFLFDLHPGTDVVIRALPGADRVGWSELKEELGDSLAKARTKGGRE